MARWMKRRIERSRARCERSEEKRPRKESREQERFRKDVGPDSKPHRLTAEIVAVGNGLLSS
jgi:hypothetical protein